MYANINLDVSQLKEEKLLQLLYEIGMNMKLGSSQDDSELSPVENYYKSIIENNVIHIYKNWGAISLFDSFIRISCNYPDEYSTWENDFFLIYIHVLHMKFYLFAANETLNVVTTLTKQNEELKNQFIDFNNDNNFNFISFKILPNTLLQAIKKGLFVDEELKEIEEKIKYLNEAAQQRRARKLNSLLLIISLLSVISVIHDMSEWLTKLGVSEEILFRNMLSPGIGISILITLLFIIRRLK